MSDTEQQPTPDTAPDAPVAPPEDILGDPGKRALDAERKARKAAEKAAADAAAKVKEYEDAQKSEAERLAAKVTELETRAAKAEAAALRAQIVNELEIPADIAADIAGSTPEEYRAAAERIKARLAPAKSPAPSPTRPVESLQPGSGTPQQSGPVQMAKADLVGMSPAQINALLESGQLADALAGK